MLELKYDAVTTDAEGTGRPYIHDAVRKLLADAGARRLRLHKIFAQAPEAKQGRVSLRIVARTFVTGHILQAADGFLVDEWVVAGDDLDVRLFDFKPGTVVTVTLVAHKS